ncbi:hypothetical protein GQ54DRAFT_299554 [Martensiomyces pterosporus]|nr:hypothetical protein GQ54DRAFT_299554 [Martensiomyces pterosporus]
MTTQSGLSTSLSPIGSHSNELPNRQTVRAHVQGLSDVEGYEYLLQVSRQELRIYQTKLIAAETALMAIPTTRQHGVESAGYQAQMDEATESIEAQQVRIQVLHKQLEDARAAERNAMCSPETVFDDARATPMREAQSRTGSVKQYESPMKAMHAMVKIYRSQQEPHESVMEYMRRFIRLMQVAQVPYDEKNVVAYLLDHIPWSLAVLIAGAVKNGIIKGDVFSIEEFANSFPGVHVRANDKRPTRRNRPKQPASYTGRTGQQYCSTHGWCYHTTDECRARASSR